MKKKSIYNEYEALNATGSMICERWRNLTGEFIKDLCKTHMSHEISALLVSVTEGQCCENRLINAMALKRKKGDRITTHRHLNGKECLGPDCIYCDEEEAIHE